ncbi:MAG: hypothetical protein M1819_006644 [Sarea resinae]|nr:MAG: hypothetical protein M1819_006644 [Sarea resinae]
MRFWVEVKVNDPSQGDGEGREGGKMVGKDRNTTAVEAYQIEVETVALVRAAEDMLSLTRSLKEAWLFGTLDTISDGAVRQKTEEDASVVGRGVERIIKRAE